MKSVYAEVGASLQQIGGNCPDGWIVMQGERPSPEHVAQADGAWAISDDAIKAKLIASNNTAYSSATAALTADYPQLEKDTWPTQDKESRAWVADPENVVTPWIDRAAFERGIDREDYLRRTLAKAEQFKIMSSFLTGRRQKYEDAIKQGEEPVLDYALTPELMGELQAVAATIMTTPIEQLREVIA